MSKRKRKSIAVDISNWGGKVIAYDGIIFTSKEKAEKELEKLKGENRKCWKCWNNSKWNNKNTC